MKNLLLTIFACTLFIASQAYNMKGVVLNTNNDAAVSDAIILLLQNNKVVSSASSGFNGEFKISAKKGKTYVMEVVKDGYKLEKADITIDQAFIDADPTITVYMQPLTLTPNLSEMESTLPDKELNPDIMEDIGDIASLPEGYKIIEAKPLKLDDNKSSSFNVNLDKNKANTKVNVNVLKETFNKESVDGIAYSDKEKFPSSFYVDGSVYYDAGKALLTNEVKEMLSGIVAKLKSDNSIVLRITAFADANRELKIGDYIGKLRVEEITKFLIDNGIGFEQLEIGVIGNTSLANDCSEGVECDEFQHQENRRVDLTFL